MIIEVSSQTTDSSDTSLDNGISNLLQMSSQNNDSSDEVTPESVEIRIISATIRQVLRVISW